MDNAEKEKQQATVRSIINPPLNVIGVGGGPTPLIGFSFKSPEGKELAMLFDPDRAQLFIADMITALNKMTGIVKPKTDA